MIHLKLFPTSMPLQMALLIYVVAPLIISVGLFGYMALSTVEKQVERQMQKDLELVARAVRLPLSYALEKDRKGSIYQALESVFSIGRVYSAYVYDKAGMEIMRLGVAEPEPERDRLVEMVADGERRGEYGSIAGRQVYSYFVPLTDTGGRITGLLHLTRKGSEFTHSFNSIRKRGALSLFVLMLFFSALILYGHHRALGMHLDQLNASMSRVAHGERQHRFTYSGPREIVKLGETFNRMLNSIDDAELALTEQRANQDELEKKLRHAEKLAAIGRLAAGTAHELGTPLSVISGKAQRALRHNSLPEQQRQTLVNIRQEVSRMEHIIRQLLDFSRSGPSRASMAAPGRLAESAASSLDEKAQASGCRITLVGHNEAAPILVDAVRVQQALINLLRNAVQCTPSGSVRCTWTATNGGVLYNIEDDGPGVPESIRSKIFEPFFTTKPVGEGTGLGLAIVHAVAEEHGGSVEVGDSNMGGASFQLQISALEIDGRENG